MAEPGFWDDSQRARSVMEETGALKGWVEPWEKAMTRSNELSELAELLELEPDPELEEECVRELARLEAELERRELRTMLRGPGDHRDALGTSECRARMTAPQRRSE